MGETTFYVAVSPSADPELDGLLEARGLEHGWGWMLFERAALPAPTDRDDARGRRGSHELTDAWARIVVAGYGLSEGSMPVVARVPELDGWTAFLAVDGDDPVAAAAVWTEPPAAYFGFAATLPEHRGKGGQGGLFAARIEHALETGCTTLVTETGELREDARVRRIGTSRATASRSASSSHTGCGNVAPGSDEVKGAACAEGRRARRTREPGRGSPRGRRAGRRRPRAPPASGPRRGTTGRRDQTAEPELGRGVEGRSPRRR